MSMMIFGTLFFLGLFIMFVSILLGQEKVIRTVRSEMEQHRMHLALLEQRLALLETEALQGMYASHVSSTSNTQSVELSLAEMAMSGGARAAASPVTSRPAVHPSQSMQQQTRSAVPPVGGMQAGQRMHQAARQTAHTKPVGAKDSDLDLFMAPPHR